MSLSIDGGFILLGLLIPAILVAAFAMLPKWFTRSMSKHSMWRLRDDLVDDMIAERLPADEPAVKDLLTRFEWAINESRSFDLLHLLVWYRATRGVPKKVLCELAAIPGLANLPKGQADRIVEYRQQYTRIAISAVFLSSWLGMAIVLCTAIPIAIRALIHGPRLAKDPTSVGQSNGTPEDVTLVSRSGAPGRRRTTLGRRRVRETLRGATDKVAKSPVGRAAHDYVDVRGPALEAAPTFA